MTTRREILQLLPVATIAASVPWAMGRHDQRLQGKDSTDKSPIIALELGQKHSMRPLDVVRVNSRRSGRIAVRDGNHEIYFERKVETVSEFIIAGALGTHSVTLYSQDNNTIDMLTFDVDCTTSIEDEGGVYRKLLLNLYWTMCTDGPVRAMRHKGKVFTFWDSWLMDNTQTLKGMKYFWPEVKANVDFYARSQREDGMMWENFEARTPPESDWDRRFKFADCARPDEDGFLELRRAPVENHVEAFFFEALYFSWKASGDTPWMADNLDAALRAVHYSTSDPYRWSTKFRLLKRGYTIDTWDFLVDSEAALANNDIMGLSLEKTHFGIFFGDNTNFIVGLRRLGEMLEAADRHGEAADMQAQAASMEDRLNRLAWNGEFFTHWIAEDSTFKLDLGVDQTRQVALSNSYSLNRNATHAQAVGIIKTYQRIRKEMPASSPGEFYAIYPPFERGFGTENTKWEYMNGGVMSCVAGELARGAFDHGFEGYGAEILRRQQAVAERYRGVIPGILRGKAPEPPECRFTCLDLRSSANAKFGPSPDFKDVPVWTGEPDNDLREMPTGRTVFRCVPFDVIASASNGGHACVVISREKQFTCKAVVPVDANAGSFYLLHTSGGDDLTGKLTIRYSDGSSELEYIRKGVNVCNWWAPHDDEFENLSGPGGPERMQVAWRGANPIFGNVGVCITAFENKHPERKIAALELESLETNAKWMVLGLTLSDAQAFLPPWNELSTGMPNNWGAAALVFALLEGLGGVKDTGVAFNKALVAPRWSAGDVNDANVCVRYQASRGYVLYRYIYEPKRRQIRMQLSSSAGEAKVAILLPIGMGLSAGRLNGVLTNAVVERVEDSSYATLNVTGKGPHIVELDLVPTTRS